MTDREQFLPIAAVWWVALDARPSTVQLAAPAGLPVHSVTNGRVSAVEKRTVGEVVVQAGDRRYHYRRLRSSTLQVEAGESIEAGQIIGTVAPVADDSPPSVVFGIQDLHGEWIDPFAALVGAVDPAELRLAPPESQATAALVGRSGVGTSVAAQVNSSDVGVPAATTSPDSQTRIKVLSAPQPSKDGDDRLDALVAAEPGPSPASTSPKASMGVERPDGPSEYEPDASTPPRPDTVDGSAEASTSEGAGGQDDGPRTAARSAPSGNTERESPPAEDAAIDRLIARPPPGGSS